MKRFSSFQTVLFFYFLLSIVCAVNLQLTEQEAYYWLWSKNLDWGYYDHPPLQAWVTALLSAIFGDERWVIRLPAMIGNTATLWIFYHWIKIRWGQVTAEFCSLLLASSAVFLMGSVIALPDSLAVPLGLLALYNSEKGESRQAGFYFGLALLAKWTVLFVGPGILYSFYRQRRLNGSFVVDLMIIPLLMQMPVIWWNVQHDGASVRFHLYGRHAHTILRGIDYLKNLFAFFAAQIFVLGFMTASLGILLLRRARQKQISGLSDLSWRTLLIWCLPGLAIVMVSGVQGQLRYYWTFLSLVPVVALVGHLTVLNFSNSLRRIRMIAITLIIGQWILAIAAGFMPVGKYLEAGFKLTADPRHSPMGNYFGWAQWFEKVVAPSGLVDAQTAFVGSDLHVASRLSWAIRKERPLTTVGVAGKNINQFQYWPKPSPPQFTKAIFFADNRYDRIKNFEGLCGQAVEWKTSPVQVFGATVKEIYWAYCSDWKPQAGL